MLRALPLRSHKARSTPAAAVRRAPWGPATPPALSMLSQISSELNGDLPIINGAKIVSIVVFETYGARRKHSPKPVIPSSVCRITYGYSSSRTKHSTLVIFISSHIFFGFWITSLTLSYHLSQISGYSEYGFFFTGAHSEYVVRRY